MIKSNALHIQYAFGKYNNVNNFVYEILNGFCADILDFWVFWRVLGVFGVSTNGCGRGVLFFSVLGGLEKVSEIMILWLVRVPVRKLTTLVKDLGKKIRKIEKKLENS